MSRSKKRTIAVLLVLVVLIAVIPLFAVKGAEFGGSDDAGSQMITKIRGTEYEPWFTPVIGNGDRRRDSRRDRKPAVLPSDRNRSGSDRVFHGKTVERKKWQDKQS